MSPALPSHPDLEWLRKSAKERLSALRVGDPLAKLADAQRELAREYGFASWRKLKAHVETAAAQPPQPSLDEIAQAFFRLVGTGELEKVRTALDASPALVNVVGPHPFWGGRPQALHVAIESRQRDLFDLLLERGADVNGRNDQYDHWSPLMLTIQRDNTAMREELLRRGARIGLVEALLLRDDSRVDELLDAQGLPSITPNGGSLLAFARTTHAIDRLIALGASPAMKDRWGTTPIDSMSRLGASGKALVAHLIERGVPARAEDYARLGDVEMLASLVDGDPDVARRDSVLMAAVDSHHYALVEWLLAHGANVNARSAGGSRGTALHASAWNGDLRMARLLVEHGADSSLHDEEHDNTPLGWAEVSRTITNNPECAEVAEYLRSLG